MSNKTGQTTWKIPIDNPKVIVVNMQSEQVYYYPDGMNGPMEEAIETVLMFDEEGIGHRIDKNGAI
jgi:hypothetical protein